MAEREADAEFAHECALAEKDAEAEVVKAEAEAAEGAKAEAEARAEVGAMAAGSSAGCGGVVLSSTAAAELMAVLASTDESDGFKLGFARGVLFAGAK